MADDAPDVRVGHDVVGHDLGLVVVGLVVELDDLDLVGLVAHSDATLFIPLLGHQLGSAGKADAVLGVGAGHVGGDGDLDGALGEGRGGQDQAQSQQDCEELLHTVTTSFPLSFRGPWAAGGNGTRRHFSLPRAQKQYITRATIMSIKS